MITTALLDLDGTLLDSTEFFFAALAHTARTYAFTIPPREESLKLSGPPLEELYARFSNVSVAALCETHRTFQEENIHLIRAFDGAAAALERLRARGLAIAAVTTRSSRTSRDSLRHSGIEEYFDVVISFEDSREHKPHSEPLEAALRQLGRSAGGAVMVGDTAADIGAGKALGIPTVGVTYGFAGPAIADLAPDIVIHRVGDLPAAIYELHRRGATERPS